MPALNVCCLPRSISSPSRIHTSSQKSWVIGSRVSTPAAKRSRRVTSPVSGSRPRIFSWTPGPPAPPVIEPATASHASASGRKNSCSGLGKGRRDYNPSMRRRLSVLVLLALVTAVSTGTAAEPARVVTATLDNGLRVLLLEDHRSPIVSLQLWYRVGSRNESRGA